VVKDMLAGPKYNETLGVPILRGRDIEMRDTPASQKVAVVNSSFAEHYFKGQNPVGRSVESNGKTWDVVGVAQDAFTTDLNAVNPTAYFPLEGENDAPQVLVAGGAGGAQQIAAIVTRIEPKARVRTFPLTDNFQQQLTPARYGAAVAGALGILALALASAASAWFFIRKSRLAKPQQHRD